VGCEARHTANGQKNRIVNNINSILDTEYYWWCHPADAGDVYGRVPAYAGIAGANIGLMMTGIGAIGGSKSKHIVVAIEETLKTITGHVIT
jgi:hypothetical protein